MSDKPMRPSPQWICLLFQSCTPHTACCIPSCTLPAHLFQLLTTHSAQGSQGVSTCLAAPKAATKQPPGLQAATKQPPGHDQASLEQLQCLEAKACIMLAASKWLNCFQYCQKALRVLGHVMVLMVLGLVVVSYYAVVGVGYGPSLMTESTLHIILSLVGIIILSVLMIMLIWSYIMAVMTEPGRVPHGWHPFADDQQARHELERMAYADYYFDRRDPRRPRFCKRCLAWKPERAHHCSVMGRCVLKMDHYCIWIVNCVGLLNYKFFMLFLIYTFLSSLLCTAMLIKPFISFFGNQLSGPFAPLVFVVVITDTAFAASLCGFLIMHFQLIAANCTTIEMYEKDRIHPWPYQKGWKRNLEEVFGRNKLRWLLPFHTKEDKRILLDSCLNVSPSISLLDGVNHITRSSRRYQRRRAGRGPAAPSKLPEPQASLTESWPQLAPEAGYRRLDRSEEVLCCQMIQEAQMIKESKNYTLADKQVIQLATAAQELLMQSYRRYISLQAKRLQVSMTGGKRVPFEDMFLAGVLGLFQAARNYHVPNLRQPHNEAAAAAVKSGAGEAGARFLTFAHHYILKYMRDAQKNYVSNDVYIPQHLIDYKTKVAAAIADLRSEAGPGAPPPRVAEVARRSGVAPQVVKDLMSAMSMNVVSIGSSRHDEEGEEGGGGWIEDQLPAVEGTAHVAVVEEVVKKRALQSVLSRVLDEREMVVLCQTMGLSAGNPDKPASHAKVAAEMGLSRMHVGRLHKRALQKLKDACDADATLRQEFMEVCSGAGVNTHSG